LRFHFDEDVAELVAAGMAREQAKRAARLEFGSLVAATEACRDARHVSVVTHFWQDLRYAARSLVREPLLVTVATISIGLGVGANLAIFGLANSLLLSTPSAFESERLVHIRTANGSHTAYRAWRSFRRSGALAGIAGYRFENDVTWRGSEMSLPIAARGRRTRAARSLDPKKCE
jgi:hypothetical protein